MKANKGAPGVDGMTVGELGVWLKEPKEALLSSLRNGSYPPQPARGVEIPKPGGGVPMTHWPGSRGSWKANSSSA